MSWSDISGIWTLSSDWRDLIIFSISSWTWLNVNWTVSKIARLSNKNKLCGLKDKTNRICQLVLQDLNARVQFSAWVVEGYKYSSSHVAISELIITILRN